MAGELIPSGVDIAATALLVREIRQFLKEIMPKTMALGDKWLAKSLSARRKRFAKDVADVMYERRLRPPTKRAHSSVIYPLLNAALLEDDDDMRKHWAHMLANCLDDDSSTEQRRAYVSIFQDCSKLDIKNLSALHQAQLGEPHWRLLWTMILPEKASKKTDQLPIRHGPGSLAVRASPGPQVVRSLWNLRRLGLIDSAAPDRGDPSLSCVMITALGVGLVEACTAPRPI